MLEFQRTEMPKIDAALPDDWVSECGVCEGNFVVRAADSEANPGPHGTFCPDCKATGLKAPGVLHWHKRRAAE